MIILESAGRTYGGRAALRPTDLAIEPGRTTCLIGPSGCGKSTLLRMVIGLVEPTSGTVRVFGEPLSRTNVDGARRRMGYVIQDGGLFPHLTAAENVGLLARHVGWDAKKVAGRVEELAALVRLPGDVLGRYPVELSGGQRQRVALMRALALDPDVLLLDEPMGALDPLIRADLQEDLRRIFRTLGKTVLIVTHDLAEAGFFADRIVLMREGEIVQVGTLRELVTKPADEFVTRFVGAQRTLHLDGERGA